MRILIDIGSIDWNLTLICRFIVIQNKIIKQSNNIGQNTGILQNSKNVQINEIKVAMVDEYLKWRNKNIFRLINNFQNKN